MYFSLGYWNCTSILPIYGGISCRLIIFLPRIGNKHGFLKMEKFKLSQLWGFNSFNMCHTDLKNWTSGYWLKCSRDYFVISQYLKHYDYLQIKWNEGIFSLFTKFLVVLFSFTGASETHYSKTAGLFVSLLWIKITLMS